MRQRAGRRTVLAIVSILAGMAFLVPPSVYADPAPNVTGDMQGLGGRAESGAGEGGVR